MATTLRRGDPGGQILSPYLFLFPAKGPMLMWRPLLQAATSGLCARPLAFSRAGVRVGWFERRSGRRPGSRGHPRLETSNDRCRSGGTSSRRDRRRGGLDQTAALAEIGVRIRSPCCCSGLRLVRRGRRAAREVDEGRGNPARIPLVPLREDRSRGDPAGPPVHRSSPDPGRRTSSVLAGSGSARRGGVRRTRRSSGRDAPGTAQELQEAGRRRR